MVTDVYFDANQDSSNISLKLLLEFIPFYHTIKGMYTGEMYKKLFDACESSSWGCIGAVGKEVGIATLDSLILTSAASAGLKSLVTGEGLAPIIFTDKLLGVSDTVELLKNLPKGLTKIRKLSASTFSVFKPAKNFLLNYGKAFREYYIYKSLDVLIKDFSDGKRTLNASVKKLLPKIIDDAKASDLISAEDYKLIKQSLEADKIDIKALKSIKKLRNALMEDVKNLVKTIPSWKTVQNETLKVADKALNPESLSFFEKKAPLSEDVRKALGIKDSKVLASTLSLDKSKTWYLNSLGMYLGDGGLTLYNTSVYSAAAKVKNEFKDVKIIASSFGGDETYVMFVGTTKDVSLRRIKKARQAFLKTLNKNLREGTEEYLRTLDVSDPLVKNQITNLEYALRKISVDSVNLSLNLSKTRVVYRQIGFLGRETSELSTSIAQLLSIRERSHYFRLMAFSTPRRVVKKVLKTFIPTFEELHLKNEQGISDVLHNTIEIGALPDAVQKGARVSELRFTISDNNIGTFFKNLSKVAKKGIKETHVNEFGFSVLNLLGHDFANKFRDKWLDTLIDSGEVVLDSLKKNYPEAELSVRKIGNSPSSFLIDIKGVPAEIKSKYITKILEETEKNFANSIEALVGKDLALASHVYIGKDFSQVKLMSNFEPIIKKWHLSKEPFDAIVQHAAGFELTLFMTKSEKGYKAISKLINTIKTFDPAVKKVLKNTFKEWYKGGGGTAFRNEKDFIFLLLKNTFEAKKLSPLIKTVAVLEAVSFIAKNIDTSVKSEKFKNWAKKENVEMPQEYAKEF